ncbi:acyl phosphate:glycerol-3-phosphate acyltransferase [Campylobacter pinnipediorum subsp. caledonicus]|uniref:Glycerol-3-phosphate acyltransferase n=1 Tax=Campylobacter pinnipediorum subsp. caledonicus TaxID=1874362 RepID=A0A1S6U6U9_9BACT|nr:glycerol-3-phosphate 1-O-acyltransferase PlsY [Campylobacter pinnipediorum]AQW85832.1 acyl phosphate:glycerol-3-phosphate acyltransferase [Campylobacter pinnipediorum subsp. caledonicus]AQW87443.1 acyl phosphate:glycerol-3-phosphate acyltransferase [Campylobacter pinnipediorum subsp. caledonicus]
MENIILYIVAYLLGAIPFGLLFCKIFANTDITKQGSCSIGATNVLRVIKTTNPKLAKKLAILTICFDALKGLLPIFVAKLYGINDNTLWAMAVLAVIGHCFSPFLKFEGGKGVATGAGVLSFFLPFELLIALFVWFIVGKVLKISSLASILALTAFIASSFIIHPAIEPINTHAPILIIAYIIIYKHIPNIKRIILKEEAKVI